MMNKLTMRLVLCAAGLATAIATASHAEAPDDIIAKRQAGMKTLFPAGNMIKNAAAAGDFDAASAKARELSATVHGFRAEFPTGSGPADGVKTRAKAEIWSDAAGFSAALEKSAVAADAIVAATGAKDAVKVNEALKDFQGSCGGCHVAYRGSAE